MADLTEEEAFKENITDMRHYHLNVEEETFQVRDSADIWEHHTDVSEEWNEHGSRK